MQHLGVVRLKLEKLLVDLLGLRDAPGKLMPKGQIKKFVDVRLCHMGKLVSRKRACNWFVARQKKKPREFCSLGIVFSSQDKRSEPRTA